MLLLMNVEILFPTFVIFVLLTEILFIGVTNFENVVLLVEAGRPMPIDFNESAQPKFIALAALFCIVDHLVKLAFSFKSLLLIYVYEFFQFFGLNLEIFVALAAYHIALDLMSFDDF